MVIKNSVEYFWLVLMLSWEKTVPQDRHQGYLDGEPAQNSPTARMAFILNKIAAGQEERVYQLLSRKTHKQSDDKSYISRDFSRMENPYPLLNGWFFEGCESVEQKQNILQFLTKLNLSQTLVNCIDEFVTGKSIKNRIPSDEETEEILRRNIKIGWLKIKAGNNQQ